ncbi:M15 family peptidase [Marinovum algicola]|uniref:M15 family peptidase n=1 Tax=Marinovum algicola TaxID=42444 RepID=UPI003B52408A
MRDSDVQMLLADAGYYKGAIDGIAGAATMAAVEITERNAGAASSGWSRGRRLIAAGQRVLNAQGFEAGAVDGFAGHNTNEALVAWLSSRAGVNTTVDREPIRTDWPDDIPRQRDVAAYYGRPGDEVRSQLVFIDLPFPLRIDWNLGQAVRRIRVHAKAADQLKASLIQVHDHYGLDRMQALGIDRFAGSYNHRRMRGGSSWSMHAYGCAVDFYAAPNALRMRCPQALFCGAEYRNFLDIMEANQWLPAVRLWGADAMHFQRATLN